MKITLDITPEELVSLNRLLNKDKDIIFKSKDTPSKVTNNYTELDAKTRDFFNKLNDRGIDSSRPS